MKEKDIQIRNAYLKLKGGVFNLKGSCMELPLRQGTQALVKPVKPQRLKIGDIIVFAKDNNDFTCHRILVCFKKDGKFYFWEKGDKAKRIGLIQQEDVIGKLEYIIDNNAKKAPPPCLKGKVLFYYLVNILINTYIRIAHILKLCFFLGRKNQISNKLGKIAWKFFHFCLKSI